MYQPNAFDSAILKERAVQLAGQISRNQQGQLSDDNLKPLRLQNGLYVQRHAPMLRIAIAYGMLNSQQLRGLAEIARKYDKGYGHLTTRQNMQLNWISLEDAPRALSDLAEVGYLRGRGMVGQNPLPRVQGEAADINRDIDLDRKSVV